MEKTFLAVKPDGVQRGLVGTIISRFESKGFKLIALKMVKVTPELAEKHYGEHKERSFFPGLVQFITSDPVVAMVWEGKGVIAAARKIIGATNPLNADNGTIRGEFGIDVGRNIIHGSDAPDTAEREIALWFSSDEISSWQPSVASWVYELSE